MRLFAGVLQAPEIPINASNETEKLEGIRPRLTRGFALPREVSSLTMSQLQSLPDDEARKILDPPKTYWLQPSWSCSDLLGAIYLQFFLWVSGNKPVRISENERCRMPFLLTRKNKRFCSDACSAGAFYHRKKESR